MKNSEKKALYDAFNIPEPERKNEFLPVFEEKAKKNKPCFHLPVIMRYASAALIAVLVIGLFSVTRTSELHNQFLGEQSISVISEPDTACKNTFSEQYPSGTEAPDVNTTGAESEADTSECTSRQPAATENEASINNPPVTTSCTSTPHYAATHTVTSALKPSITVVPLETTINTQIGTGVEATLTTTVKPKPPASSVTTVSSSQSTTTTVSSLYEEITQTTTTSQADVNDSVSKEGIDYTITPEIVFSSSENAVNLDEYLSTDSIIPPSGDDQPDILNPMAADSDYIISGYIDEILYTSADGKPYTVENLTITNIYKDGGKLSTLDKISLYVPGGYMTARDFTDLTGVILYLPDDAVVYDPGGNNGTQNLSDEYVFFIKDAGDAFPEGTFRLTQNTDISVFQSDNGTYTSLGNSLISFTLNELKDLVIQTIYENSP